MAARTIITAAVPDWNGATITPTTCESAGKFQYLLKDKNGKNQILTIVNGSEETVTVDLHIPYQLEDRYPINPVTFTIPAGAVVAYSERPLAYFGQDRDGGSGTGYLFFDAYIGPKLYEGDTIDAATTKYVVLSGTVELDEVTYTVGDVFTTSSDVKTDWEAGVGDAVIAEVAGEGVYILLTNTI